jgi:chaperone BCS1
VILKEGYMEEILEDVERFFTSAEWYQERGIPYQLGFLFYGEPGNGKTSLCFTLASHFSRDIYLMKVAGISDDSFRTAMNNIPKHSIVLIEDVDCFFEGRDSVVGETVMEAGLTFSGFLNGIDGVSGSEGRLLIMTTNKPEKLDQALTREGRVDHKVKFADATKDQAHRLFLRFFPGQDELAQQFAINVPEEQCSMAKLQGHLLKHRDSAADASQYVFPVHVVSETGT